MNEFIFCKPFLRLKTLRPMVLLVLGLFLFSMPPAVGQSKLSFDPDEGIVLPNDAPMPLNAEIDLGGNFEKEEEASDYFKKYNTLVTSTVLEFEKDKVSISFYLREHLDWTVEDWNHYLKTLIKEN